MAEPHWAPGYPRAPELHWYGITTDLVPVPRPWIVRDCYLRLGPAIAVPQAQEGARARVVFLLEA